MAIIADTGPLYSLADQKDPYHKLVAEYIASIDETIVVPSAVVPEACYLINQSLGAQAEIAFLRAIFNQELVVQHFTDQDLGRAIEILEQYRDANFGMVDVMVMALAERMKARTILTIDRRDFSIFRPRHCDAFTLVPDLPPAKK